MDYLDRDAHGTGEEPGMSVKDMLRDVGEREEYVPLKIPDGANPTAADRWPLSESEPPERDLDAEARRLRKAEYVQQTKAKVDRVRASETALQACDNTIASTKAHEKRMAPREAMVTMQTQPGGNVLEVRSGPLLTMLEILAEEYRAQLNEAVADLLGHGYGAS